MAEREDEIRLYAAAWSPECRIARRFLERHRVSFRWIDVDADPAAAAELTRGTGSRIVPALRIGARWVVVQSREKGFLYREAAAALGIPLEAIPETDGSA